MFLIVGLGNPGQKYKETRHNIGARAVNEVATNFQFPIFNFQSIFNAKISKGTVNNRWVILAKPQTFMNNSGVAVKKLIGNWKLEIRNLIVIHDDLDLLLGKIRIVKNRSSAGHKGVESIIKELGTKNFIRLRVGILPKTGRPRNPEKFVLQKFNKDEKKIVEDVKKEVTEAVETLLKGGLEKAQSTYH